MRWLDPAAPWAAELGADPAGKRQQAFLAARVSLRFDDTKAGLDTTQEWEALYGPLDAGLDLDRETAVDYDDRDLRPEPPDGAAYVLPNVPLDKAAFFRDAAREIQRRLTDTQTLELLRNAELKLYSRPGETEEQFAARADEAAKARRRRGDGEDPRPAGGQAATGSSGRSRPPASASSRRRSSRPRAAAPSSSPASAARSASSSAARPTRGRSRGPAVRSAAPRAAAA